MHLCTKHAGEKCICMAHFYPITILPSTVHLCTCVCRVASLHCSHAMTISQYYCYRAGEIGPDTPVLARPVFLKVKIKCHFYKRQVINKSACVIFGLGRLIILSQKKYIKMSRLLATHARILLFIIMLTRFSVVQKESSVINRIVT